MWHSKNKWWPNKPADEGEGEFTGAEIFSSFARTKVTPSLSDMSMLRGGNGVGHAGNKPNHERKSEPPCQSLQQ